MKLPAHRVCGRDKKIYSIPPKKRKIWHCNALPKKGLLLAGPFFVWAYWLLGTRQVTWTEEWKSEKAQQQSRSAKRILIWFFFVRFWKVLQIGNCYCGKKCEFHTASGDHFAPFTFWTDSGYQQPPSVEVTKGGYFTDSNCSKNCNLFFNLTIHYKLLLHLKLHQLPLILM